MGNNEAYRFWEATILHLYNADRLTLPILDAISQEYRGMDIDSGGSRYLETKDHKSVEQVCVELIETEFTPSYGDILPWTWQDQFSKLSHKRWGWT